MSGDAIPERRIALTIPTNWVLGNGEKAPTQASLLIRTEVFALAWLSRRALCHGGLCHEGSGRVAGGCALTSNSKLVPRPGVVMTGPS